MKPSRRSALKTITGSALALPALTTSLATAAPMDAEPKLKGNINHFYPSCRRTSKAPLRSSQLHWPRFTHDDTAHDLCRRNISMILHLEVAKARNLSTISVGGQRARYFQPPNVRSL